MLIQKTRSKLERIATRLAGTDMIYIQYFGPLATELGTRTESLPWDNGGTTESLLQLLRSRNPLWASALAEDKIFKLVVQKQICHQLTNIPDGVEVAILPPVTGG